MPRALLPVDLKEGGGSKLTRHDAVFAYVLARSLMSRIMYENLRFGGMSWWCDGKGLGRQERCRSGHWMNWPCVIIG